MTFIPDIGKCLKEVRRVLKPTGVAFLGGRYLYTPYKCIKAAGQDDRIRCQVGSIYDLPFDEGSFDLVAGVGPLLIWGDHVQGMRELYRVLRPGGAALVGGRYLYMPQFRKVPSEKLRESATKSGISSVRVIDDMGQWVEVRKGIKDRGVQD